MKIAIIGSRGITNNYGGIERVLVQLCPRIAALGHEVHVYGSQQDSGAVLPDGVRLVQTPALGGKYTETLSRSFAATLGALAGKYDVINLVAVGPGILSPLPRIAGTPVVVSIHGLDWARDKWPLPARIALKMAERTIVQAADEITVVSEQLVRYFRETYRCDVFHTPNGVDIRQGPADAALLAEMGLEPEGYVLFASRLVKEKAAHELIASFNRVKTDKKLVIAGGDRYDREYVETLRRIDTTQRCVFVGHLDNKRLEHVFKGAALYVLPSHLEGFSLSLLEALGYGKAILVSDISENVEAVGEAAAKFPVGDIAALACSIEGLLANAALREALGRRAHDRAAHLFSWDFVTQRYLEAYSSAGLRRLGTPTRNSLRSRIARFVAGR